MAFFEKNLPHVAYKKFKVYARGTYIYIQDLLLVYKNQQMTAMRSCELAFMVKALALLACVHAAAAAAADRRIFAWAAGSTNSLISTGPAAQQHVAGRQPGVGLAGSD